MRRPPMCASSAGCRITRITICSGCDHTKHLSSPLAHFASPSSETLSCIHNVKEFQNTFPSLNTIDYIVTYNNVISTFVIYNILKYSFQFSYQVSNTNICRNTIIFNCNLLCNAYPQCALYSYKPVLSGPTPSHLNFTRDKACLLCKWVETVQYLRVYGDSRDLLQTPDTIY